jgi:outer membrane protein TolC
MKGAVMFVRSMSVHRMKAVSSVLAAMGALVTLSVHGQTLSQAVDAAWARNPQAAALSARQDEAQARLDVARSLTAGPPAVSLNHLTDRANQNLGRREWEVEVSAPMWLPGQRSARETEAGRAASELAARSAALRLQLAGDVREAWWTLAAAREARALAQQRLDTAQELAQAVQRRFKTGDLARLDANVARTESLAAQADLLDADAALREAQQSYRLLTGVDAPSSLLPETDGAAAGVFDPASHPQVQALQALADLSSSRVALADASRRDAPELALRWTSQRDVVASPYDKAIGVKLTIPLSSDARVRQEGAAARADLAQADAELAQARSRVDQDVARAKSALDAAEHQLAMALERRALTADNLRLAQRSFELGESDLSALMRARAADYEAQAWFKKQEVARFAAQSRLHQAQGVLP